MAELTYYKNLIGGSKFDDLTFSQQLKAKEQVLLEDFKVNNFTQEEQQYIYDRLMYAPPKLEDPKSYKALTDAIEAYRRGDEDAAKTLIKRQRRTAAIGEFSLYQAIGDVAAGFIDMILPEDSEFSNPAEITKDDRKMHDYINFIASAQPGYADRIRGAEGAGKAFGFLGDLFSYFTTTGQGLPSKLASVGIAKSLAGGALKGVSGRALPTIVRTVGEQGFRSIGQGITGLMRENYLSENVEGYESRFLDEEGTVNIAKTLGDYAVLDFAWAMGASAILPFVKNLGRMVKGTTADSTLGKLYKKVTGSAEPTYKKGAQQYTSLSPTVQADTLNRAIKMYEADTLDPTIFSQLPDNLQNHFIAHKKATQIARRPPKTWTPDEQLIYGGRIVGTDISLEPNGAWRVSGPFDDGAKIYNSYGEVAEMVGDEMTKAFKSNPEWSGYLQRFPAIFNYSTIPKQLSSVFDVPNIKGTTRRAITEADATGIIKKSGSDVMGGFYQSDIAKGVRLAEGDTLFKRGEDIRLSKGTSRDVFVPARKIAPLQEYNDINKVMARSKAAGLEGPEPVELLTESELVRRGYDSVSFDPKWRPGTDVMPDTIKPLFPDEVRKIDNQISLRGTYVGQDKYQKGGAGSNDIRNNVIVSAKVDATVPDDILSQNKRMLVKMASGIQGDVNPQTVKKIGQGFFDSMGISGHKVTAKVSDTMEPGNVRIFAKGDDYLIETGKRISNTKEHARFVDELFDELTVIQKDIDPKTKSQKAAFQKLYKTERPRFILNEQTTGNKEQWLSDVVAEHFGGTLKKTGDGKFYMQIPKRKPVVFDSLKDAEYGVLGRTMSFAQLQDDFALAGYKLRKTNDLYILSGAKSKDLFKARNLEDLLTQANYRPSKISSLYGPKLAVVDESTSTLTTQNKVVSGPRKQVLKYLDNFRDYDHLRKLEKTLVNEEGTLFKNTVSQTYEVRIPKAGIIEQFDNVKDARRYIEKWDTYQNLKRVSHKKGVKVEFENGQYVFRTKNKELFAKTQDEISDALKAFPDPEAAPDLLEGSAKAAEELKIAPNTMPNTKPSYRGAVPKLKKVGPVTGLLSELRNTDAAVRAMAKQSGHEELIDLFTEMMDNVRISRIETKNMEEIIDAAFYVGGKPMDLNARQGVKALMEAGDDAARDAVIKQFGLGEGEINAARHLRDIYGSAPGLGLGGKFNIPMEDWIQNYVSRIRSELAIHPEKYADIDTAEELLGKIFRNNNSRTVKFWADNSRVEDIVELANETDAREILKKYNRMGHQKLYLSESFEKINNYFKNAGDTVPPELKTRINVTRDMITNHYRTPGEEMLKRFNRRFFEVLDEKGLVKHDRAVQAAHRDLLTRLRTVNYGVNMAWKAWLPIRNSFQIFTTLNRWGITNITDAMKNVNSMGIEDFRHLQNIGVVQKRLPLVGEVGGAFSNPVFRAGEKVAMTGLNWFGSSDDITRAVAYHTAKVQWDEALSQMKKGKISTTKDFMHVAGVDLLDEGPRNKVISLFEQGQYESALNRYGVGVAEETMFNYAKEAQGVQSRGVIGSLFGQYGTYAAGYVENLRRGLRNGTPAQRAAFIGRAGLLGVGLHEALKFVGIEEDSFLPWNPTRFTGGPLYDLANTALKSIGSGYSARQARGELKYGIQQLIPGSSQYKALTRAMEAGERGDSWGVFLALTSTPAYDAD